MMQAFDAFMYGVAFAVLFCIAVVVVAAFVYRCMFGWGMED